MCVCVCVCVCWRAEEEETTSWSQEKVEGCRQIERGSYWCNGIVCAKIGRCGSGCVVKVSKRIPAQPTATLRQVNLSVIVDEAFADRET